MVFHLSFPLLMIFFACLMLFPLVNVAQLLYIIVMSGSQARIHVCRGFPPYLGTIGCGGFRFVSEIRRFHIIPCPYPMKLIKGVKK